MRHKKYYIAIIVLVIFGVFIYNQKSDNPIRYWFANRIKFKDVDGSIKSFDGKIQFQSEIEKMQHNMGEIDKKLTWINKRVTLLGVLANENLMILGKGYDKSKLIFLNVDWSIDKMPEHVKLEPSDKEFLQQFLKDQ